MKTVLIVEDDQEIAEIERDYLEINGIAASIAADTAFAAKLLAENCFDLILLDVMLPNQSGYEFCREIRDDIAIPILMVTARTEPLDRIRGLGLGADDYILKPFDPAELVARVKSHLARYERLTQLASGHQEETSDEQIKCGELRILPKAFKVFVGNKEIRFTNREFALLLFLAENPNIVFSREQLFEKIWGFDYISDSATVTVHINRIREKIEADPKNPKLLETIWGAGYRFNR